MSEWASYMGQWAICCASCGTNRRGEMLHTREAWKHRAEFEASAMQAGWRLFVGRGRRWYCPKHGPSARHRMHEVTR